MQSYGQRAVGFSFNPSGNPDVQQMKLLYAEVIDRLSVLRDDVLSPEHRRLCSIAITEAQTAQMWAVKAITWID
jgi:hypothetical protein